MCISPHMYVWVNLSKSGDVAGLVISLRLVINESKCDIFLLRVAVIIFH